MADNDDRRRSVYELFKLNGLPRGFMAADTEAAVLHKAVFNLGLPAFEAKCLILGGADECDVTVESRLDRTLEILLAASADGRRRLKRGEFDRLVRYTKALSRGALEEHEARRKVRRLADKLGIAPLRDGLLGSRRWFTRIKDAQPPDRAWTA